MWYTVFVFTVSCILIYILKQLVITGPNMVKFYSKFFIFYFWIAFSATVVIPYSLLNPKDAENQKAFSHIFVFVNKLLNLKYQIRDKKFLSEDGGAIIIGNHQSILDVSALSYLWTMVKYKITVTMKNELFYMWPFGLGAYLAGVIFVNRNKIKNGYKQLDATKELVLKNKTKIWFFPEGTRNKDYTKLLPFKKGAFYLAIEAQVPILPVVFSPYYFINTDKYIFNNGHIIIQCLEPVTTTGLTLDDVPDLIKKVYDKMTVAYQELYKEVTGALPKDYPLYTSVG